MNKEDRTYNQWLGRIKKIQPEADDPQRLTAAIMSGINALPQRRKNNRFLLLVSSGTSIAAILLVGLFLLEQAAFRPGRETNSVSKTAVSPVSLPCEDRLDDMDMHERITYIMWQKEEHARERQAFYTKKTHNLK